MGASTMSDETIHSGEFNAAMKAVKEGITGLGERISRVEALQQSANDSRVEAAREEGRMLGRMEALESRLNKMDRWVMAIGVGAILAAGDWVLGWINSFRPVVK